MFTWNRKKIAPTQSEEEQAGPSRVSAKNILEGSIQLDMVELEAFIQNTLGKYPV